MNENKIINANFDKLIFPIPLYCFSIIALIKGFIKAKNIYQNGRYTTWFSYEYNFYSSYSYKEKYSFMEFFKKYFFEEKFGIIILVGLLLFLISSLIFWRLTKCSLTVTDKRLYGKRFLGSQFDLPIENVLGVSGNKTFKGFTVSTSSKTLRFYLVKNVSDIHKEISSLIMSRTNENTTAVENKETDNNTTTDELKKFKELLDMGVITQEEFDAKKKQLLGL